MGYEWNQEEWIYPQQLPQDGDAVKPAFDMSVFFAFSTNKYRKG